VKGQSVARLRFVDLTSHPAVRVAPALQRIWFATTQKVWTSLAVVPADAFAAISRVPELLVEAGQHQVDRPLTYLDTRGVQLPDVQAFLTKLRLADHHNALIVAVDPLGTNPAAEPILRGTSAALLVVRRGKSQLSDVRRAIHAIGSERLIGMVSIE